MKRKIKKRVMFYLGSLLLATYFIFNFFSNRLIPVVNSYAKYQCNSISAKIINHVIQEQLIDDIKDEMVVVNNDKVVTIEFNTFVLNSIVSSSIKKIHYYFYKIEHGQLDEKTAQKIGINLKWDKINRGIVYEVPFSRAFNNILISNLGIKIPVRYQLVGEITGQVTSSLKEYGINNALLEINLQIMGKTMVITPLLSSEETLHVSIPLVIKLIQGNIPESLLGTNVLGGM